MGAPGRADSHLTKSGGQEFHGAVYEYVRNDALQRQYLDSQSHGGPGIVPPFRYNQYGYNVGGPSYIPGKFNTDKSKFFWYWGQEWVKYRFTDTANWTVPTHLMRQGNFSELLSPTNVFYGKVITIKDPATGVPFPDNVIPNNQFSPNGLGILKAYPQANLSTPINGTSCSTSRRRIRRINAKIHWRRISTSPNGSVCNSGAMNYTFWEYQPLDGTPGETPKYFDRPNQTNSLDHVWTVSSDEVNEAPRDRQR